MTELLKKEFSRRSFVKGGGAMVVGFSVVGAGARREGREGRRGSVCVDGPVRPAGRRLVDHDPRRQHGHVKIGKVELGQGTLTGILMIAGEELDMSLSQMKHVQHDTNVTPIQGSTVGSQGIQRGGQQTRGRGRSREGGAAEAGLDEPRRPGREPVGRERRRLGRRQDRHLRRADRRQAVQRQDLGLLDEGLGDEPGAGGCRLAGHEAGQPVQARRHEPAARRHPGQGDRQVHLRPQHQGAGDDARPRRPAARPGRLRRRHGAEDPLGRRELDQASPGRADRPLRRTSSASSRPGVRGDPGGRPAQGEVGRPARAPGCRQPLEADARPRQRRQGAGADRVQQRQLRQRVQVGRAHGDADLHDALHGPHADRPGVLRRRRDAERRPPLQRTARASTARGARSSPPSTR